MIEDQMVGWHHHLNGHESEQARGEGEGQGSLVCYSPWGCKVSDTNERLNNNNKDHCPEGIYKLHKVKYKYFKN